MNQADLKQVDRVKTYTFSGFPEMAGRIAMRTFDPPKNLSGEEQMLDFTPGAALNYLMSFETRVHNDILDQVPRYLQRAIKQALKEITDASRTKKAPGTWNRSSFLDSCLSYTPSCVPIILPGESRKGFGTFYYILNYPSRMTAEEIYKIEHEHDLGPEDTLPKGFKKNTRIMTIAHEFAHVILNEFYPVLGGLDERMSAQRHEVLCDIFSFACNYALEGDRALATMSLFVEARLKTAHLDAVHNTGAALDEAILNDLALLRVMKPREVFEYGDDLCARLNII